MITFVHYFMLHGAKKLHRYTTVTFLHNLFSVKCGGLLSSSADICFEAVLSEMVVEIGTVGTTDEVILEIW